MKIWHLPQLEKIEAKLATLSDMDERRCYVQAQLDFVAAWNEVCGFCIFSPPARPRLKVGTNVLPPVARTRAGSLDAELSRADEG